MANLLAFEMGGAWIVKLIKVIALTAGVIALSACATVGKFEKRMEAKKGLTKEQLIDDMGIPDKEYKSDSFEVVEYNQHDTVRLPNSSSSYVIGNQIQTTTTNNTFDISCKLEFKLVNGVVKNYRYKGRLCTSY
ncbi:hypothetical protein [Acinetobacter terrae]|uniref:Uncharacterized protein n=1 Tax=Acinetobacter terrae TaxID=2731247 RepID=A0A4R0ER19_9GAMM|nr:hypothetical protein [Acinetobacter terrae]TCB62232.1 hypothetical protein E0H85_01545 [Acinetobacter terrae]